MRKCVVFCAGGFDAPVRPIEQTDVVIAADGGLLHTNGLGLRPDVILGDFDSLGYVPERANVFPVEKDDTDAMLAVRRGLALGCRAFVLYGCMDGPRLDHTVAALQTLQYLADHDAEGTLVGLRYMATVVKNGSVRFPARAEGIVSVFCMGSDAHGVTLEGLQYELRNGVLTAGFPLGVSNHFVGKDSRIAVRDGSVLVLWDRKNGLPKR